MKLCDTVEERMGGYSVTECARPRAVVCVFDVDGDKARRPALISCDVTYQLTADKPTSALFTVRHSWRQGRPALFAKYFSIYRESEHVADSMFFFVFKKK